MKLFPNRNSKSEFNIWNGKAWDAGYIEYRDAYITRLLDDPAVIKGAWPRDELSSGFGIGLDERCIEYPWVLSRLNPEMRLLLDVGSTLNHSFLIDSRLLQDRKLTILTLFPEKNCFWQKGISYVFDDARRMPFREGLFDTIVCISTLEHIGYDNSIYTNSLHHRQNNPNEYLHALSEMWRVLRPGGALFVTVPYGRFTHLGFSIQFDKAGIQQLVSSVDSKYSELSFFGYSEHGWHRTTAEEAGESEYVQWVARAWLNNEWPVEIPVEPDRAAAARSVCCLRFEK
jgi:SAM-dependent methyltransferase